MNRVQPNEKAITNAPNGENTSPAVGGGGGGDGGDGSGGDSGGDSGGGGGDGGSGDGGSGGGGSSGGIVNGGGDGGGAEATAGGGGGEEVTGTQQLELQTEHKPLENGSGPAGQQVEDGSGKTTEVDGTETSERIAKLDSPLVGVGQSEDEGAKVCVSGYGSECVTKTAKMNS